VATTNDLKNGMTLNIDGQLWNVVDFQHVKPGKGGAFVRTRLKNIMSGKVVDRTFNAGVKVDVANVDKREMQYLYREGDDFVFMDTQDYDQPRIPRQTVGGAADYLLEEQTATVAFNDGNPLYVELPASVELTVSQTGRAGRPVHRWHQARHAGDRCPDQRAAVHHHGRKGEGGHPHGRLHGPRVNLVPRVNIWLRTIRPAVIWPADQAKQFRARP
jgi:elongation factor P